MKVLAVESIGNQHHPRAIGRELERPAADKSVWLDSGEKRERKLRPHSVPEENQPVPLDRGKGPLCGERRNRVLGRHAAADAVGGVFPMMEGTLKTVPDDATASQVGGEVRACRIKNRHFAAGRTKGDQPAAEPLFRNRATADFRTRTEQVPGGRMIRKILFLGNCSHGSPSRKNEGCFIMATIEPQLQRCHSFTSFQ
jgi:hypothetical protein